NISDN
ncbi:hypothetical protein VCHC50A2_3178B, partial [Vibrio cholerae HC-50A2]